MTIKDRAFRATRAIKLVQPPQPDPIGKPPGNWTKCRMFTFANSSRVLLKIAYTSKAVPIDDMQLLYSRSRKIRWFSPEEACKFMKQEISYRRLCESFCINTAMIMMIPS